MARSLQTQYCDRRDQAMPGPIIRTVARVQPGNGKSYYSGSSLFATLIGTKGSTRATMILDAFALFLLSLKETLRFP